MAVNYLLYLANCLQLLGESEKNMYKLSYGKACYFFSFPPKQTTILSDIKTRQLDNQLPSVSSSNVHQLVLVLPVVA